MAVDTKLKREEILAVAFSQFCQYGFRKTSMEDIAQAMGISRASLYTYFNNKEEIFRGACQSIGEQTIRDAEKCLKAKDPSVRLSSRIHGALMARYGQLIEITQSPHGNEIYDENNRLCGDLATDSMMQLRQLIAATMRRADRAGEICLKEAGVTATAAAELIQLGAVGLKHGAPDVATYEKRLRKFVLIFLAGLGFSSE